MHHEVNLNIIHRYLAGECTAEEKHRIREWIEADPANRRAMDALRDIWEVQPRKELESDLQSAWRRLEEQLEQREQASPAVDEERDINRKRSYRQVFQKTRRDYASVWLRVAAVIIVAFLLSLFITEFRNGEPAGQAEEVAMREVVTKRGHQAELTFSDGTKVILNAASLIRFPERFDTDVREVYLEGEAYFDVAHDADIPFLVQTQDARVEVLGTRFNVKARPENQEAEIVVAQGKVSVQSNTATSVNGNAEVILNRGEMSTVRQGHVPAPPRSVDTNDYLTWLRGDFVFDREPFSEVLREWERRFDIDFVVEDSSLVSVLFSGEFRNEPLEEMLRLASRSLGFGYHRDDQTIVINKQK